MLTWEDDVEVHALRKRGWTISAIARHTGFDRKTVRKYLDGDGQPGVRARPGPDPFDPFVDYVSARLTEDPHLWARTLLDELEELGFGLSYQSLTRNIRQRSLRPVCEACRTATERPNAVIPHAPGDETQWDWLELPNPPEFWGWGKTAHLLVGSLAHSAKWRAALSPSEDQPHLVAGLDRVTRGLGGVSRVWRFDRMATVCDPGSGRVTASFAGVAKHYGVAVAICPPRRGNRKGVVEKVNHTAAQRWWRTLADEVTVEAAQGSALATTAMRAPGGRLAADGTLVTETERLHPQLPDNTALETAKALGYFKTNAHRMRYAYFRELGLFVGSGVVEAGCKSIVGQRLKLSGMRWNIPGATGILTLRCQQASDRFDQIRSQPHNQTATADGVMSLARPKGWRTTVRHATPADGVR